MSEQIFTDGETYDFPLSFAQERVWFLQQYDPLSVAYNISATLLLEGLLDQNALQQAIEHLSQRHETLRTVFAVVDGQPVQRILPNTQINIEKESFTGPSSTENKDRAIKFINAQNDSPFSMESGPLVRLSLIQFESDRFWLHFCVHHIIADGWSVSVLVKELASLYETFSLDTPPLLPELPIQYADYTLWQREHLQGDHLEHELNYWRSQLKNAPALLNLPLDHPRSSQTSADSNRQRIRFSNTVTEQLQRYAQQTNSSLYMVLVCAFNVLLSRLSGQNDIVTGTVIANRTQQDLESLIGFFVNTLPIRTEINGNPSFDNLLAQVKQTCVDAYAHQELPFEKLVEALQPERELSFLPLTQVLFVLQNTPDVTPHLAGLKVTPLTLSPSTQIKFDLEVYCEVIEQELVVDFMYRRDLFEDATVESMSAQFQNLLINCLENPEQAVFSIPLTSKEEQKTLVNGLFWQAQNVPETLCIHQWFEQTASIKKDSIAINDGQTSLSFDELNHRANHVAHALIENGVEIEDRVGICLGRTTDLVVALLGVLKAGACYVPLDPEYPSDRLNYMLKDSDAKVVLTHALSTVQLPSDIKSINVPELLSNAADKPNPIRAVTSSNLAYIIYTSGSTGKPKGVAIEHNSAVALISWAKSEYSNAQLNHVLAATSVCFDLSIFEIFVTLAVGGTIQMVENATVLTTQNRFENLSLINTVPSVIRALFATNSIPKSVKTINLAGEPLRQDLVEQLYSLDHIEKVYDLYGPSEDTTYSTYVLRTPGGTPSIGQPISNTLVHIVDENLQLLPQGITGELLIGGKGLARGYFGQPELTKKQFIANPFSSELSSRLYRTGDLVRLNSKQQLEYIGRRDHQIKIHGFRIELGEIETRLNRHPNISQSLVTITDSGNEAVGTDNATIVAYLVPHSLNDSGSDALATEPAASDSLDIEEIKQHLMQYLPRFMIPSVFMILPEIPLLPNGKTNYRALPVAEKKTSQQSFIAPNTKTEKQMADIWCDVLQLNQVGVNDNFFELGGHSLLATQIIARLNSEILQFNLPANASSKEGAINPTLSIKSLFEYPTIAQLAGQLESSTCLPVSDSNDTVAAQLSALNSETAELSDADIMSLLEDIESISDEDAVHSLEKL